MGTLSIFKKLTQEEAEGLINQVTKWFEEHPRRKVCRTDLFPVRKIHIREDVLKHTQEVQPNA